MDEGKPDNVNGLGEEMESESWEPELADMFFGNCLR